MTYAATKTYKNIPVAPAVYEQVEQAARANGSGLGAMVAKMVARELPPCGHKSQVINVEQFAGDLMTSERAVRSGYYCPVCKRVYIKAG